jgi:hypothetical protein
MGDRTRTPSLEARFFAKLAAGPGDCWTWTAYRTAMGYGRFNAGRGQVLAHRWSYEFFQAQIPEGLELDHLCRNRACVNPEHLDPVPHAVNVRRGQAAAALNARKTHCYAGHPFTPANTRIEGGGRRRCETCRKARVARHSKRAANTHQEP